MPLVVAGKDKARARALQRRAASGQLRRIYAGIYTDDLLEPLESVVRRELFALCSLVAPGAIISHRSALEGGRPTAAGNLFLAGPSRRDFELPGVRLRMVQGLAALSSDIRIPTATGDVFISGQARALLENLTFSRRDPAERRTLGAGGVEDWLTRLISHEGSSAANRLRHAARSIAACLGLEPQLKQLDDIIVTLLGGKSYGEARVSTQVTVSTWPGLPWI
jgi:hypothetical protein